MHKCRRDVLFYDYDKNRFLAARDKFEEVCHVRYAGSSDVLEQELSRSRPDLMLFNYAGENDYQMAKIQDVIARPQYKNLMIIAAAPKENEATITTYFDREKIRIKEATLDLDEIVSDLTAALQAIDNQFQVLLVDPITAKRERFLAKLDDRFNPAIAYEYDVAIRMAGKMTPDVVIIRGNERDFDGIRALDYMRENAVFEGIPFAMVSTEADKEFVMDAISRKINTFLLDQLFGEEVNAKLIELIENENKQKNIKTLLVVDDDPMNIKAVKSIMGAECQVVGVNNSEQALKYCGKYVPNLILLDYEMPQLNGLYVLQKLRMDARFNYTPIVMLTGNSQKNTVVSCMQAGAQGYLTKPINAMNLRLRVRQFMGTVN